MADNPPPPGKVPPLQQSSPAGRKGLTTQLPNPKGTAGKIVVMLSSVAKTASLPPLPKGEAGAPPPGSPAPVAPPPPALAASVPASQPAALPPKQVVPSVPLIPPQPRLSTTTVVQLPPKTAASALVSLAGKPLVPLPGRTDAEMGVVPPIMPKHGNPTRAELRKTGIIRLNSPVPVPEEPPSASDSILLAPGETPEHVEPKSEHPARPLAPPMPDAIKPPAPSAKAADPAPLRKPEGWKSLEPGELPPRPGGPVGLDAFARTQRMEAPPVPVAPVSAVVEKPAPLVVPPRVDAPPRPAPALNPAPVALSGPAVEAPSNQPLHVAPPMVERGGGSVGEKLPAPHPLPEARKDEPAPLHKAPAMIPSEDSAPAKPLLPPALPGHKPVDSPVKQPAPPASSITPSMRPAASETKPALKPAVLPKRATMAINPSAGDAVVVEAKGGLPPPLTPPAPPAGMPVAGPASISAQTGPEPAPPADTRVAAKDAKSGRTLSGPVAAAISAAEAKAAARRGKKEEPPASAKTAPLNAAAKRPVAAPPLPSTRVERSKKRRLRDVIIFWVLIMPLVVGLLLFGLLHFGRDTRVEGQVIPPDGMALNNEVWIVSDFRELASGIAEDLAAERAPLMQEIQERRDHVQRAQADVAAREERIRLVQEQIQATKDEVNGIVKGSREATQKIWDGEGASIDGEYQSKLDELRHSIEQRARTLNLKYTPDETYQSPEVWANAYRLALYQVPTGVDSVKEYQWLSDQMKAWRDFQKTLDTRKEQLREKAAQVKLEPAPKIADLNAKIDDLNQRIEATQAEEVPLKAELDSAKADLAQAQSADATLDDKYYKQLDSLPAESVTKHISLRPNGRFTWVDDDLFAEGQTEHKYWIFARAVRADGRQYWALQNFKLPRDKTVELTVEPGAFLSTKSILRPNLSPDEQDQ